MRRQQRSGLQVATTGTPWSRASLEALPSSSQLALRTYGSAINNLADALRNSHWYLKGSTALLAYVGPTARLPRDLDLSVVADTAHTLLHPGQLGRSGGDQVAIVRAERVTFTETQAIAPVYRVLLKIGSRPVLGELMANVLVVPNTEALADHRLSTITFPTTHVTVPAARLSRCLAQKLLRYTKQRSEGRVNTRWTDLLDFLIAAESSAISGLGAAELRNDVVLEFAHMARPTPTEIPEPPMEWLDFWDEEIFRTGATFGRLPVAGSRLREFWEPVLSGTTPDVYWNPNNWSWEPRLTMSPR